MGNPKGQAYPKGSACYMLETRYPPDHPVHLVALFDQQVSQIRTILAGDTGDKGFLHGEAGGRLKRRGRRWRRVRPARRDRAGLEAMGERARRRLGEGGRLEGAQKRMESSVPRTFNP